MAAPGPRPWLALAKACTQLEYRCGDVTDHHLPMADPIKHVHFHFKLFSNHQ